MKRTTIAIAALALCLQAGTTNAQQQEQERPRQRESGDARPHERKPEDGRSRRPVSPLIHALDANRDGVIDATEISTAPTALAKLDKNSDGRLTREELRPPHHPPHGREPTEPRPAHSRGRPSQQ